MQAHTQVQERTKGQERTQGQGRTQGQALIPTILVRELIRQRLQIQAILHLSG